MREPVLQAGGRDPLEVGRERLRLGADLSWPRDLDLRLGLQHDMQAGRIQLRRDDVAWQSDAVQDDR